MAKYSLMPDQQKLVEDYLYLVEIAVKQYIHTFGRTPGIEWDDLYQTGCLALCNAAHCYNPEFPFPPYASKAIRNALHDYCRSTVQYHKLLCPLDDTPEPQDTVAVEPFTVIHGTQIAEILQQRQRDSKGVVQKGIYSLMKKSEGYNSVDISKDFGVSPNSVRAWMSLAAKYLREDTELNQLLA